MASSAVAFGRPEIGKVISDRSLRPGVIEGLARKRWVHLGDDRMEAFGVTICWVVHYRIPAELRIPVRYSVCVHEFHALDSESPLSSSKTRG